MRSFAGECLPSDLGPQEMQARFQELDRKAQVEFRHAEFTTASEDFHQAACSAPASMRLYYGLYETATSAVVRGDLAGARQALQEADRLRPDYPLPLAMLVKVNMVAGDIVALKKCLLEAAHRFPGNGKLHAELSQDLLHEKHEDLALAEALRAGQAGGANPRTSMNLAALENRMGAMSDAARLASLMERQSELPHPTRASAAALAGLSFESLGRVEDAARSFKRAITLDPGQEQPYLALSRIYAAGGNYPASVDILEQARNHVSGSQNILLALGSALVSAERHQPASEILSRLIRDHPEQLEAYPRLAAAYRNMGEPARATETLRNLAGRKPDYPMLHTVIAQSLLDEDSVNYPQVLRELDEAERASPGDYEVQYLRGKVFLATGKYERAIESLRRAIAVRPTEPGAYYQLGLAYRKSGALDRAREQFERWEFLNNAAVALKARE
jgi:tetratricopeptide (TPR) repeat protein